MPRSVPLRRLLVALLLSCSVLVGTTACGSDDGNSTSSAYRAGKFKKGADGRTFALVKAGLAGGFAYNRLKAATENAKGDPLLSKAVAPLTAGIASLKGMATKLRKGEVGDGDVGAFESVINDIKDAGKSAGAEVKDKVPSASQLGG
ncbi:hypothetical protein [Streptomyces sp. OR43]|uniref:hypothetical protein n=1 Tax=Streptomyces sp. or43 TaxID=2478957 RepID=UPI0011CD37A8|nr:hypothetical protein [Streptomyces sp. or43]TXS42502.1 hypothetical protein EAO72_13435 [Streptomyces sp. or43]